MLPGTIRGTVLGFSARAPHNESAIEVTFGLPNFASSLARVFKKVYTVDVTTDRYSVDSVKCPGLSLLKMAHHSN